MHEYITVWSKDQLTLDGGGPTGISGNEFVAWTRSIWRPEDGLKDLQRKIEAKLADARRRGKDDAWIAESIARSVWAQGAQGADESQSIWSMTTETGVDHPAPFPEELPRRLMLLYTEPGDVVLDPFMGSGSTAVAAVLEGRHYVGYEISAEYCRIAEERVKQASCERKNAG